MAIQSQRRSKVLPGLRDISEAKQWESFIVSMLKKLELPEAKRQAAERSYKRFGLHIAHKLGMSTDDVHVVVQGSMRTQTTIAGDGRENFDLDVVVKLSGSRFTNLTESEDFFQLFGAALQGIDGAGEPEPKNRCWRLPYPGEPFYFDVTPAIPLSVHITGTDLRVRDKKTVWSPSNPEDFANWFCAIAAKRFPFQMVAMDEAINMRTQVDPIPNAPVALDDILRRLVQLMKLHRDYYFKRQPAHIRETSPISIILVTLAGQAYDDLLQNHPYGLRSSIEVVMEIIARMPDFIDRRQGIRVNNPAMPGQVKENFADRWNTDGGARNKSFNEWHERLTQDLEALFTVGQSTAAEERVRAIFGEAGVRAWKGSQEAATTIGAPAILAGLKGSSPSSASGQPQQPRKVGSRDTLA
ncbi:nucleotidyltransferase [Pseudomonas sp. NPDC089752]|uniref:nucleotidyltransferase domain-containing protein n=1 Tax=Pseudomonas sp. NPDC089752 TaxID=3364472 RepID=UPI0037F24B15